MNITIKKNVSMYKRKDKGETITDAALENRKSVYRERRHDLPYNFFI